MAHLLILSVVLAAAALLAPSAAWYPPMQVCNDTDNFSAKSRYLANINLLGATLPTNTSTSPNLFATAKAGTVPDQVSALALCRGDTNATDCLSCLAQAFRDLPNACAYNKDATIYYDKCTLHYSGTADVLAADDDPGPTVNYTVGATVASDPARFNRVVAALVNATADYAAYNSTRRYAAGEADSDDQELPRVYSLAQCTPDLTPARCRGCLARIILPLPELFTNYTGGTILGVRCGFRYDTDSFLDGPVIVRLEAAPSPSSGAPAELAPSPSPAGLAPSTAPAVVPTGVTPAAAVGGGGRKYSVPGMVLIVLLPILAAINLIVFLCFWRRKRPPTKGKQSHLDYTTEAEDIESVDSMMIDISTLRSATGDFAESNKLGEGGFGAVYKGILPDGDEIAVKRLSKSSTQGVEELKNELALVAKLKHKNLVRLVGVCLEQQERLLVYEFVPNRSLDQILFDSEKREQLDWEKRYNIINGIARGLQYLHEDSQLKVIHRDLKASNILLDTNMNPKISDFGLARLFGRAQTQGVTNRVVGTYGYMAPEYVMRGNYSVKSDAYSFGVMVLEIVTGRKNNDCYNSRQSEDLLTMIWEHWTAGTVSEMVDASMKGCFSEGDVLRCIHIGLMCVQGNPADRPVMSSVVMMLGSDTVSLQAPSKPAFFARNGGGDKSGVASSVSTASVKNRTRESLEHMGT